MTIDDIVRAGMSVMKAVVTVLLPYQNSNARMLTMSQMVPEPPLLAPVTSPAMPVVLWVFRAILERVVDGDTIDVLIDHGMHELRMERLRLLGVDTPEVVGATKAAGLDARLFTYDWLKEAHAHNVKWPLVVQTEKTDVFGRYLAVVWRISDQACLNYDLLAAHKASVR